jgi:hypothetical protein
MKRAFLRRSAVLSIALFAQCGDGPRILESVGR